jgi:hypothetical protein
LGAFSRFPLQACSQNKMPVRSGGSFGRLLAATAFFILPRRAFRYNRGRGLLVFQPSKKFIRLIKPAFFFKSFLKFRKKNLQV